MTTSFSAKPMKTFPLPFRKGPCTWQVLNRVRASNNVISWDLVDSQSSWTRGPFSLEIPCCHLPLSQRILFASTIQSHGQFWRNLCRHCIRFPPWLSTSPPLLHGSIGRFAIHISSSQSKDKA